jgi:hypothetical protein
VYERIYRIDPVWGVGEWPRSPSENSLLRAPDLIYD